MLAHNVIEYADCLLQQEKWGSDILNELSNEFQIIYFGGVVRDFLYGYMATIRDVDIVLCPLNENVLQDKALQDIIMKISNNINVKRNQFGGYKLIGTSIVVDIWLLKNTWAYRNYLVPATVNNLLQTVYLNIDAYALIRETEQFLCDCNRKRYDTIDIVLEESMCEELNLIRAVFFSQKYNLCLSKKLLDKIHREYVCWKRDKKRFNTIQERHYGHTVISLETIESRL